MVDRTPGGWTAAELALVRAAVELEVAARRPDASLRPGTPIWVVVVGEDVYVRTWYRRATGWFGAVLVSQRAQVTVPGLTVEVTVEDVGAAADRVDAAYREKYGAGGAASMVTDDAAATTLRLTPERPAGS